MGHIVGGSQGDSEGSVTPPQVCGFPDGFQHPEAVWHRGAPVCTLSHTELRGETEAHCWLWGTAPPAL